MSSSSSIALSIPSQCLHANTCPCAPPHMYMSPLIRVSTGLEILWNSWNVDETGNPGTFLIVHYGGCVKDTELKFDHVIRRGEEEMIK